MDAGIWNQGYRLDNYKGTGGSTEVKGNVKELKPPPKELTVLEEGEVANVYMGGTKWKDVKKIDGVWHIRTFGDDFVKAKADQIKRINKEYE
jgi:hypothetical protein